MVKIRLQKRYKRRKSEMAGIRLQKRARKKAEVFFPDDIMINILNRLPIENILRCRLVCKRWRYLTSFKESQMRCRIPMILVAIKGRFSNNFLLDNWWEPSRRTLVYHRFVNYCEDTGQSYRNVYCGKFSHGGLVVFQHSRNTEVFILNPTSHKNVQITLSKELWSSEMYGVFFHPSLREYCTLWRIYVGDDAHRGYYKILNLGSKPCWRDISNPWGNRVKFVEKCDVLFIGENLYWLVKPEQEYVYTGRGDIMEFDIRSENFGMMHCPVPLDVDCARSAINLLDIGGVLSFVLTSRNEDLLNVSIWKLKDRAQPLWVPTNHCIRIEDCSSFRLPKATAVLGDQLVLSSFHRLYICNFELGTTRTVLKEDQKRVVAFSHVMSLASLKHCKSKIFMNKEGEVEEESDLA